MPKLSDAFFEDDHMGTHTNAKPDDTPPPSLADVMKAVAEFESDVETPVAYHLNPSTVKQLLENVEPKQVNPQARFPNIEMFGVAVYENKHLPPHLYIEVLSWFPRRMRLRSFLDKGMVIDMPDLWDSLNKPIEMKEPIMNRYEFKVQRPDGSIYIQLVEARDAAKAETDLRAALDMVAKENVILGQLDRSREKEVKAAKDPREGGTR